MSNKLVHESKQPTSTYFSVSILLVQIFLSRHDFFVPAFSIALHSNDIAIRRGPGSWPKLPNEDLKMTTLVPRSPYTQEELDKFYPKGLELRLVQVLLRHGERAPVSARFGNVSDLPG
jgi:hypothetical protein